MPDIADYIIGMLSIAFGVVFGLCLGILLSEATYISFGILLTAAGWRLMCAMERKYQ